MSKVEGGGGPINPPPPPKCSCNYFFFEASRVKNIPKNTTKAQNKKGTFFECETENRY